MPRLKSLKIDNLFSFVKKSGMEPRNASYACWMRIIFGFDIDYFLDTIPDFSNVISILCEILIIVIFISLPS